MDYSSSADDKSEGGVIIRSTYSPISGTTAFSDTSGLGQEVEANVADNQNTTQPTDSRRLALVERVSAQARELIAEFYETSNVQMHNPSPVIGATSLPAYGDDEEGEYEMEDDAAYQDDDESEYEIFRIWRRRVFPMSRINS